MNELQQLSARALARDASLNAIEFEKRWYTWGEMRRVAEQVNALIESSGVDARAPIAFVPRNRPSAIATLLGLLSSARSLRMIYAFQAPAALARDVARLKPLVLIAAEEDFSDELRAALRAEGSAAIALKEMQAAFVPGFERAARSTDPDAPTQPQVEILTSGTTGPPKQFALSYELIARHMVGQTVIPSSAADDLSKLPPILLFMPLGNISGIYSTLPPLLKGQQGVLLERFSVAGWHDHVRRFRPTVSGLPPAGVQMVLDANIPPEDISSVKFLGTGAAPLDPTAHRAFEERYGIAILLSYGATEFGGPVTAMTADLHAKWGKKKFGSVGRALPGVQLRVRDPQTDEILPPGKEGILEVISPRIGPNWIRTSDIAMIDEDGFMFHRGRADGAIMRGGFKLLPETIERALMLHPAVSAAGVVGVPDRRLGQVPAAAIRLKPDANRPTIDELESHLRNHVLATHIPVHWKFVDTLPMTPSVKVDRSALRKLFEADQNAEARSQ